MVTKSDLHRIIDELPDDDLEEAARRLRDLDRFPRTLSDAEEDEEALTDEDIGALAQAREDLKTGRTYTQDEIESDLGL